MIVADDVGTETRKRLDDGTTQVTRSVFVDNGTHHTFGATNHFVIPEQASGQQFVFDFRVSLQRSAVSFIQDSAVTFVGCADKDFNAQDDADRAGQQLRTVTGFVVIHKLRDFQQVGILVGRYHAVPFATNTADVHTHHQVMQRQQIILCQGLPV